MARCKMSPCDAIDARLADLPDLGDETRIDLERHAETCQSCRAKLAEYRALMAVMAALRHFEAPLHVDGERLTRFAIHRAAPTEPDHDQMRLSGVEIQQIEGHVRTCPRCRLAVDSILEQYREVDIFLAEAGVPPTTDHQTVLEGLPSPRARTSLDASEEGPCLNPPVPHCWRGPRLSSHRSFVDGTLASGPVPPTGIRGSNRNEFSDSRFR